MDGGVADEQSGLSSCHRRSWVQLDKERPAGQNTVEVADLDGVGVEGLDGVGVEGLDGVEVADLDGVEVVCLDGVGVEGLDGVEVEGLDGVGVVEGTWEQALLGDKQQGEGAVVGHQGAAELQGG